MQQMNQNSKTLFYCAVISYAFTIKTSISANMQLLTVV